MTNVHSKALDQSIQVERIIGHIKGLSPGPTLIFTGGIHGNEPSGVFALKKVVQDIQNQGIKIKGNFYAISGNLWALERGVRFHKEDLNRVWTKSRIMELNGQYKKEEHEDIHQQKEILAEINSILTKESGPFYFFDLHTTSSATLPFLTVNDSMQNRKFTMQYPLPIILGIEEYLDGPLLSYINELGYVAFGFEAGQHDTMASIENNVAFIYLSMLFCGAVCQEQIEFHKCYEILAKTTGDIRKIYEIYFRYLIKPDEDFKMRPGFFNFQRIRANQEIADSGNKVIRAKQDGRIFMPLYQAQGVDGFFAIRKVLPFFLVLSGFMRRIRIDRLFVLLPGVNWYAKDRKTLVVNRKIAIFFAKQFFHLMGYRSKTLDKNRYIMKNREDSARNEEYENEIWYR
ncbi:MAG: succinylglutamate desuccinylase/aspartoacylase family protein [Cyclobacteriaceae bacterium]